MSGFVARNKADWDELEELVARARISVKRMTPEELGRLDTLYRRATIHLSQVTTRTRDRRLARYLNDLTAAAHGLIYLPPRKSMFAGFFEFVFEGFARALARNWRPHAISAALLIGGAALAYFAAMSDPMAAYAMLPRSDARQPGATHEQLLEILRSGRDTANGGKFMFASFLFSHNLKVGLLAMATGILAGIPSVLLIFYNRMNLGAFIAVHRRAGIDAEMWAWILPHGITELGAIILCGGIGLILGHAVIAPGLAGRTEALRKASHEAGITSLGVAGMLCFAAVIESFLRQSDWPTPPRLVFAACTALFWILFIVHGFVREHAASLATKDFAGEAE